VGLELRRAAAQDLRVEDDARQGRPQIMGNARDEAPRRLEALLVEALHERQLLLETSRMKSRTCEPPSA